VSGIDDVVCPASNSAIVPDRTSSRIRLESFLGIPPILTGFVDLSGFQVHPESAVLSYHVRSDERCVRRAF
jgi:hypothetical protein